MSEHNEAQCYCNRKHIYSFLELDIEAALVKYYIVDCAPMCISCACDRYGARDLRANVKGTKELYDSDGAIGVGFTTDTVLEPVHCAPCGRLIDVPYNED